MCFSEPIGLLNVWLYVWLYVYECVHVWLYVYEYVDFRMLKYACPIRWILSCMYIHLCPQVPLSVSTSKWCVCECKEIYVSGHACRRGCVYV